MIRWNVARLRRYMARHGIQNPSQFAAFVGLTKPTAANVLSGEKVERIESATLEAVCRAFKVTPSAVIELVDNE